MGCIKSESSQLNNTSNDLTHAVITQSKDKHTVNKLEAQWAEPVSLTFHSSLKKLNTEPPIGASHQVLVIWLSSYREEDI